MATVAMTTTYEDVQELVRATALRFHRRYGGDLQEILQNAGLLYTQAYYRYKEERGSFARYVKFYIFRELQERLRNECSRNARLKQHQLDTDQLWREPTEQFSLSDFVEELGQDARKVVELLFAEPNQPHQRPTKGTLRRWLHNLGWTARRIVESFDEITRVLLGRPHEKQEGQEDETPPPT